MTAKKIIYYETNLMIEIIRIFFFFTIILFHSFCVEAGRALPPPVAEICHYTQSITGPNKTPPLSLFCLILFYFNTISNYT